MDTQCNAAYLDFPILGRRELIADFDGGDITSDGGALLLRKTEQLTAIIRQFAACFTDHRKAGRVEHTLADLVAQRVYALALGYEDLNDHDVLRRDPLLAAVVGKLDPKGTTRQRPRDRGKPLAGKSTLNRLELTPVGADADTRYKKVTCQTRQVERLFVTLFLQAHSTPPEHIVLDLDATDDPVHGHQLGRFFHGYYKNFCYLPLYIFCGDHLLCARLRPSDIDGAAGALKQLEQIVARIREAWPQVKITVRADSGFCREPIMAWCERRGVDYVLGLAQNTRLVAMITDEQELARQQFEATRQPARVFAELRYQTWKPGAASGVWWPRRSTWPREPTRGSWSRRCRPTTGRHSRCTSGSTAAGARWRTGSRSSNCTCSRTGPAPTRCGPTRSGCSSRRSLIRCSTHCDGWVWPGRNWPVHSARRSG